MRRSIQEKKIVFCATVLWIRHVFQFFSFPKVNHDYYTQINYLLVRFLTHFIVRSSYFFFLRSTIFFVNEVITWFFMFTQSSIITFWSHLFFTNRPIFFLKGLYYHWINSQKSVRDLQELAITDILPKSVECHCW